MRLLKYKVIGIFESIVCPEGRMNRRQFLATLLMYAAFIFANIVILTQLVLHFSKDNPITYYGPEIPTDGLKTLLFAGKYISVIIILTLIGLSNAYLKRLTDIGKNRKWWIYLFYILLAHACISMGIWWGNGSTLIHHIEAFSIFSIPLGEIGVGAYNLLLLIANLYFFCLTLALLVWPGTPDKQLRGANG